MQFDERLPAEAMAGAEIDARVEIALDFGVALPQRRRRAARCAIMASVVATWARQREGYELVSGGQRQHRAPPTSSTGWLVYWLAGLAVGLLLASLATRSSPEATPTVVRPRTGFNPGGHHQLLPRPPRPAEAPTAATPSLARPAAVRLAPTPWSPRACPSNCSGHGSCNLDTGECLCALGYAGAACAATDPLKCHDTRVDVELVTRCVGVCDETALKCVCGGGRYPRRPMFQCEFRGISKWQKWRSEGWNHARVADNPAQFWSKPADAPAYLRAHPSFKTPLPKGKVAWCDAEPWRERPAAACNCHEGSKGGLCEIPVLMACLSQCNGRGHCKNGMCVCDPGWYGVDCSLRRGKVELLASALLPPPPSPPPPPPRSPPEESGAPRPRIYVYELPPEFNVQMLATKTEEKDCATRAYSEGNETSWHMHAFGMEVMLTEGLLASRHRVADPRLADYFYVPVWGGCFMSRFSRPVPRHHDLNEFRHVDTQMRTPRAARTSELYRRALRHIAAAHPYWNASGGKDHLWSFPHDEGACLAPIELAPSVLISHWGRTQRHPPNHTTISAGHGWHTPPYFHQMYGREQCYTRGKDVLLPIYKSRPHVVASPYLTGKPTNRHALFNFRGNALNQPPHFSMGMRQQLFALFSNRDDACEKVNNADGCTLIGGHSRSFIDDIQRSTFCGVLMGNGWAHIEEPVIHGCIPVLLIDGIDVQLEGVLDVTKFSVRVPRDQLPKLLDILRAIPKAKVREMQGELAKVWERYTYSSVYKREYGLQRRAAALGRGGAGGGEEEAWTRRR